MHLCARSIIRHVHDSALNRNWWHTKSSLCCFRMIYNHHEKYFLASVLILSNLVSSSVCNVMMQRADELNRGYRGDLLGFKRLLCKRVRISCDRIWCIVVYVERGCGCSVVDRGNVGRTLLQVWEWKVVKNERVTKQCETIEYCRKGKNLNCGFKYWLCGTPPTEQ